MKNLVLSAIAILTLVFIGTSCSSDDNNSSEILIQASELPIKAKTFPDNVLTNIDITRVEKETKSVDEYYEVYLTGGIHIDFNQAGEWTEVDGNNQAIPTGFINPNIVTYVTTNYSATAIESIDKKAYGFDVDLLNNIELRFDFEGNFLGTGN